MTTMSHHWPKTLIQRSQAATIQTNSHRMRIPSLKTARKTIYNRAREMKPRGLPLRSSTHAPPKRGIQGRVLGMIYRHKMSTRSVPQVHSLVKPAAKSMEEMTTPCKSGKTVNRSKAS